MYLNSHLHDTGTEGQGGKLHIPLNFLPLHAASSCESPLPAFSGSSLLGHPFRGYSEYSMGCKQMNYFFICSPYTHPCPVTVDGFLEDPLTGLGVVKEDAEGRFQMESLTITPHHSILLPWG